MESANDEVLREAMGNGILDEGRAVMTPTFVPRVVETLWQYLGAGLETAFS